jgi:hypothetical protein
MSESVAQSPAVHEVGPDDDQRYRHTSPGRQLEAGGRAGEAIEAYRSAIELGAGTESDRCRLAVLLTKAGKVGEAVSVLKGSAADRPDDLAWLHRELSRAMRSHDLGLAGDFARVAAQLRWGIPTPTQGEPIGPSPSFPVSVSKLLHDADQFEFLTQRGILSQDRGLASLYRTFAEVLSSRGPNTRIPIESEECRPLWPTYNRLLWTRTTPQVARALSADWDAGSVESQYLRVPPGLVVIDDFLTKEALGELRAFCLESTVWFANRYGYGRLGAFFHDGFNCPLLLQIAEELRKTLPHVIGDRYPLRQVWGFKNSPHLPENSTTHADFAAVNVNFWITPDEANLKPDKGGMIIYDVDAPLHWDFETYNGRSEVIQPFLVQQHARSVIVPYRQNRAIIFNSDLFHGTCEVCFRPEYENRRINVTFLYGDRENDVDHPGNHRSAAMTNAWRSRSFARMRR